MRCHEARQRLIESRGELSNYNRDKELLEHLRQCPDCARLAQTEMILRRDLKSAAADDMTDTIPWSTLKDRVESQAGLASGNTQEISFMNKLAQQMKRRPRVGISMAVVVVLLAFLTLVPFKFERAIGYEVAIAGVDRNLAMDEYKIQQLLDALGIEGVTYDVSDCEATCHLKISDLKSEDDIRIVVTAFNQLGKCELEGVVPILEEGSSSLMNQARKKIFIGKSIDVEGNIVSLSNDSIVCELVIDKLNTLNEETDGEFNIWIFKDSSSGELGEILSGTPDGAGSFVNIEKVFAGDSTVTAEVKVVCLDDSLDPSNVFRLATGADAEGNNQFVNIVKTEDGALEAVITDADGVEHRVDLNDEDAIERLKELGLNVDIINNADSCKMSAMFIGENELTDDDATTGPNEKEMSDNLPEGYYLSQNYPNPFNPLTQLNFTIPKAEKVTLEIFNINGQKVKTLVDGFMEAGEHTVGWDATDDAGGRVASGMYLYKLTAGGFTASKKMTLLK